MELILDKNKKKEHLYLEVFHYYRELIMEKKLPPGSRMPSLRKCSQELKLSRTTIENAYLQLAAEGYIISKAQSGYYVTDTHMAESGINKRVLSRYGGEVFCFISDEDVAATAKANGTTRATASMDKAAAMGKKLIFAIGNAPTALVRLYELIEEGKLDPELIIGVPVGFVNVVQSKELIMQADVPYIVARGRKGGSNVAACICNALLYMIDNNRGY